MPKKPSAAAIRAAVPLSQLRLAVAGHDPFAHCNVCGGPSENLGAWREHDERDQPLPDPEALVFIGRDHPSCLRAMERHPRLYAEERGDPGTFPGLCGDCPSRRGFDCGDPRLRKNGGAGLFVELDDRFRNVIMCGGSPRRIRPIARALRCEGHPTKTAVRNVPAVDRAWDLGP